MANEIIEDELSEELAQPLPDGTYRCVTRARVSKGNGSKPSRVVPMFNGVQRIPTYLSIEYVIVEGPFAGNNEIRDFWELFPDLSREAKEELEPEESAAIGRIGRDRQSRMIQLGIPKSEVHRIDVSKLNELDVFVVVKSSYTPDKRNKDAEPRRWLNIDSIQLANEVEEKAFSLDV